MLVLYLWSSTVNDLTALVIFLIFICTSFSSADPFYVTFDGSEFAFKGDCKYNFFNCDEITMYADHVKDKASSKTKSIEVY